MPMLQNEDPGLFSYTHTLTELYYFVVYVVAVVVQPVRNLHKHLSQCSRLVMPTLHATIPVPKNVIVQSEMLAYSAPTTEAARH